MDAEDAVTIYTQVGGEAKPQVARVCPQCCLSVPLSVAACPKDGTLIDDTLGEGRRLVGNYEFLEFIGSGGMGVIYKARNPVLKRLVAIKMLHSHLMSDVIVRRFQQEAEAVSGLSHNCIIGVHDYGISEHGQPYMVMDYIDGKPLSDILRQGQMSAAAVVNIGIQLADALQHAHENGVLHRDLKPSNIMVMDADCSFPEVKIVDFGIAKILESDSTKVTQTGELLGTPQYMSPEQCRGAALDARSDIYSLGCVLFEALTGKPPFSGSSMVAVIVDQISKSASSLAEARPDMVFPAKLEDFMARALAKEPADRYQSMKALLAELMELQSIVYGDEAKGGTTTRGKRINREQRQLLLISLAAGLSLLGVGASSIMLVNMAQKALVGKVSASKESMIADRNQEMDKLLSLERSRMARFLDARRMNDQFFRSYYSSDLGGSSLDLADSHVSDRSMQNVAMQKSLNFLTLDNSNVSDAGIAHLRGLKKLLELHLDRTSLSDLGMKFIAEIPSLKNLSIRGTSITDKGVQSISSLNLRSLFLSGTEITDESLKVAGSMRELQRLAISNCPRLRGTGFVFLQALPTLQYLDANNSSFNPAGYAALTKLAHLIALELSNSNVTAGGIKQIANMKSLEYLNLSGNRVETSWLPLLAAMPRLRSLSLNSSKVDAQFIKLLPRYLPELTHLQFRFTPMSDEAAKPLSAMRSLKFLDLDGTGVTRVGATALSKSLNQGGHAAEVRF